MESIAWKIYFKFRAVIEGEEGQDLVEYALTVALISLAAVAGMNTLASAISTTFTNLGTTLTGAL